MKRLLWDIESDGLLHEMTKIHCIVIKDLDSGEVLRFHDSETVTATGGTIEDGIQMVELADLIIGHNIIKFDIPAIQKFYPSFLPRGQVRDTLVMARLIWPNLMELDSKAKVAGFPKQLTGRHSLEAWGHRLKAHKGTFGKNADWKVFTQEMLDYCVQDVCGPTQALWDKIQSKGYSEEAIQVEHDFAKIMFLMEEHGFPFNEKAAHELHAKLGQRRLELGRELQGIFKGWSEDMKTPECYLLWLDEVECEGKYPTKGEAQKRSKAYKGHKIHIEPGPLKSKHTPFNPGSRDHIARVFTEKYGWKPKQFTDGGKPQIDESVLEAMTFPEAKLLLEYMMLEKRLGMLAEGDNAWLKLVEDGRIHGEVNPMGTVTSRCSHSKPNMGQVTSVTVDDDKKPLMGYEGRYGYESRSLFIPNSGHVLVGADASGIQLRALAHYLARWDGGKYVELVTKGDVHTVNQQAAGIPNRDMAKTFIYAWLLGAGDAKIGQIVGKGAKEGKELKARFLKNLPAFKQLKDRIAERVAQSGSIIGLDGRIMPVGSAHLALGSLLQGFEAVVMKKATHFLYQILTSKGYQHGTHWGFCAMVHDEWQISAQKEIADDVGKSATEAIKRAGEYYKSRCPLTGAYKIGGNWAETH